MHKELIICIILVILIIIGDIITKNYKKNNVNQKTNELEKLKPILKYYENIGYKVISNKDIESLKQLLEGKVSVESRGGFGGIYRRRNGWRLHAFRGFYPYDPNDQHLERL